MRAKLTVAIVGLAWGLSGCANDPALGQHVSELKRLQTYNPEASQENKDIIPDGNGERMEDVYNIYTGKKSEALQGTGQSQVLNGF